MSDMIKICKAEIGHLHIKLVEERYALRYLTDDQIFADMVKRQVLDAPIWVQQNTGWLSKMCWLISDTGGERRRHLQDPVGNHHRVLSLANWSLRGKSSSEAVGRLFGLGAHMNMTREAFRGHQSFSAL